MVCRFPSGVWTVTSHQRLPTGEILSYSPPIRHLRTDAKYLRRSKVSVYIRLLNQIEMVEANADSRVSFRLQREDATQLASSLARAKEAHALEVEVECWFQRTARESREDSSHRGMSNPNGIP